MSDDHDLVPGLSHVPPRRRRRRMLLTAPSIALSMAVIVGVVVVFTAGVGKVLGAKDAGDYVGDGTTPVEITVHKGDSARAIARTLEAAGVVKSTSAFIAVAEANPDARNIQPGIYKLKKKMSAEAAVTAMLDPHNLIGGRVTIPEGTRLSKTISILTQEGKLKEADIAAALAAPTVLRLPDWVPASVKGKNAAEGFLFPATYVIDDTSSAVSVLRAMVARFSETADAIGLRAGAAKLHLSPYQVVIVASLIEAEVKLPQDYPRVARVIYNRLAKNMPLQLDSTVNYALGTSDLLLTRQQLDSNSPYNTYKHGGLPPGPIDSPGKAALQAALAPAAGDWLYFVTVDPATGETQFTSSLAEFNKFKQEFQQNVKKEQASK